MRLGKQTFPVSTTAAMSSQWHLYNKFWLSSVKWQDLSEIKPAWFQTHLIPNLSTLNMWDTEPIRHWTSKILNISYTMKCPSYSNNCLPPPSTLEILRWPLTDKFSIWNVQHFISWVYEVWYLISLVSDKFDITTLTMHASPIVSPISSQFWRNSFHLSSSWL